MIAENTSAMAAPMPTVEPMPLSTGTFENASRPKPTSVDTAANSSDTMVRLRSWPEGACRSKNSGGERCQHVEHASRRAQGRKQQDDYRGGAQQRVRQGLPQIGPVELVGL